VLQAYQLTANFPKNEHLGFVTKQEHRALSERLIEAKRMLSGLIQKLDPDG